MEHVDVTLVDAEFPDEEQRRKFESGWPAFLDTYVQLTNA